MNLEICEHSSFLIIDDCILNQRYEIKKNYKIVTIN